MGKKYIQRIWKSRIDKIDNAIIYFTGFFHIEKKNINPKIAGLKIVGHHTIKDAVDAVDQNNSTFNTTYEHQLGKTCYDSIYFMCLILSGLFYSCFLYIFHYISIYAIIVYNIKHFVIIYLDTSSGHLHIIFWIFLELCVLLFAAWLCFIIRTRKTENSKESM